MNVPAMLYFKCWYAKIFLLPIKMAIFWLVSKIRLSIISLEEEGYC